MRRFAVIAALLAISACAGKYVRDLTDEKVDVTPERVERGRYLVENVASCGVCHDGYVGGQFGAPLAEGEKLGGGNWLAEVDSFGIWVPNITADPETGIGQWTDDEVMRAIRDGVRPDGRFLFPVMPFSSYQHMSDDDLHAIVAYLRSVPKVKQTRPRRDRDLGFIPGIALSLGVAQHEPTGHVEPPDASDPVRRGEYLARLGHCAECHSLGSMGPRDPDDRFMAGADEPMQLPGVGKVWPRNLTPDVATGLGRYSAEQIEMSLRSGLRLDGKPMAPPMSAFIPHLARMSDADMKDLVHYLRSLPAVGNAVPERDLSPQLAAMLEPK